MLKLIIKDVGKLVEITGKAPFRTPASINIEGLDLNIINQELRKQCIINYQIKDKKSSRKSKVIVKNKENNKKLYDKIDKLEKMVNVLLNRKPEKIIIEKTITKDNIEKNETNFDKVEDFIPSINNSSLIINSKTKCKYESQKGEDIREKVNLLKNISKKK